MQAPPNELCCPLSSRRLDLAGVKDPLASERDGISFAPVLRGEQDVLDDPEKHRVAILVEKPVGWPILPSAAHLVYQACAAGVLFDEQHSSCAPLGNQGAGQPTTTQQMQHASQPTHLQVPTGIFDTKVSIMVPDVPFGLKVGQLDCLAYELTN